MRLEALLVFAQSADPRGDRLWADATNWLLLTALAVGVFLILRRMLRTGADRKHSEVLALHRAALDIHGQLMVDSVLQKVVDAARELLGARYGALAVLDEFGEIDRFASSGIPKKQVEAIGDPPRGAGLLGVPIQEGRSLIVDHVSSHPSSVGFPPNHPRMKTLVAVPVLCTSPYRGNLYVADRRGGRRFTAEDRDTLARFATQAALAIDNAHVHDQLRSLAIAEERVRIAREMHDGMAQVLAYVNTKAQAVSEYLRAGRVGEAEVQLGQLAMAVREVYVDVREGILALRSQATSEKSMVEALESYLEVFQDQTGIQIDFTSTGDIELDEHAELQLLRIIQESMTNIRKHSDADEVAIRIVQRTDGISVEVKDNGRGFDPLAIVRRRRPQFGLATMKERAESIGATLDIDSQSGRGTTVRVSLTQSENGG